MASAKVKQKNFIKLTLSEKEAAKLYEFIGENSDISDTMWVIFDALGEVL